MASFRSDNNSGICPEGLQAIIAVNDTPTVGYGSDPFSEDAVAQMRRIFGEGAKPFFVTTGTAANALALAALLEPWQRVLCHKFAHFNSDESTAPERFAHCRVVAIETDSTTSKLTPADIERNDNALGRGIHEPQPGAVSITNPTEFGEVYTPAEVRALADTAHRLGYHLHMDGARFGNAVARLGCDPRALTADAGLDALSFGGTKNGLAMGEAVIIFPHGDGVLAARAAARFPFLRKSMGHLVSKHRFITAPFAAALRDGAWLRHAAHANAMADRLKDALAVLDLAPRFPVQANGVFVSLPQHVIEALQKRGYAFLISGEPEWRMCRFMMSFDTKPDDVDALVSAIRGAL